MANVKLDRSESVLFNEVGSRGDYFREALRDKAAQEVNETGRMSEVISAEGEMLDVVMAPKTGTTTDPDNVAGAVVAADTVVPPTDLSSVVGKAPEPWEDVAAGSPRSEKAE